MLDETVKDILKENDQYKYWIKASPLARINPEEWIVAIYKKGKVSWITDECKSGFSTPEDAYNWALGKIDGAK